MEPGNRWLGLFLITRIAATVIAATLLGVHAITSYDPVLIVVVIAYGAATALAAPRVGHHPLAWIVDAAATLALVLVGDEWRSPFYLLAITALVLPTTALPFRRAVAFTFGFTGTYFVVAVATGVDWNTLDTTSRLESFSTHLMVPVLVGVALAYASHLLGWLEDEKDRSARLAVEAERSRIAWELHDSAKQRVHAAHLVLSAIGPQPAGEQTRRAVDQAMTELHAATAEMETSLSDLRAPLAAGGLDEALKRRAAELEHAAGVPITVSGKSPPLSVAAAAHAFRIAGEAMTNAVRHAEARTIAVRLDADDGRLCVVVTDDGRGMPAQARPGAQGTRSMQARAKMLGGRLEVGPGSDGEGTRVRLEVPLTTNGAAP